VYGRPEVATYTPASSSPRFSHLRAHLRAYLVGVGATTALTAGALVVFLSLATFLAFHGLPLGGSSDDAGVAYLDSNTGAAPTAAAALGAARGAVAKNAAPGPWEAGRAARSAAAAGSGAGGSGSGGGDPSGKVPSPGGPSETGVSTAPVDITPPAVAIPSLPSTSGPATDAVQGVDNATGTSLSGSTGGVTRTADGEVSGALNRAGGVAGRAGLGG